MGQRHAARRLAALAWAFCWIVAAPLTAALGGEVALESTGPALGGLISAVPPADTLSEVLSESTAGGVVAAGPFVELRIDCPADATITINGRPTQSGGDFRVLRTMPLPNKRPIRLVVHGTRQVCDPFTGQPHEQAVDCPVWARRGEVRYLRWEAAADQTTLCLPFEAVEERVYDSCITPMYCHDETRADDLPGTSRTTQEEVWKDALEEIRKIACSLLKRQEDSRIDSQPQTETPANIGPRPPETEGSPESDSTEEPPSGDPMNPPPGPVEIVDETESQPALPTPAHDAPDPPAENLPPPPTAVESNDPNRSDNPNC